ncbi:hypothetical protein BDA96_01G570700 [Sorghum bicolor]|uniref:Uncharacterized protein n=2 Tax=Sorghum bicolor TaxID=4558 RepID=A0A921S7X7_SORBI|nr:hypothetical protein BDA96_01G570700 [Sorghum bicolor]KXG40354.1 hypothetical protein SORBI_3001G534200 [Sorghum bicolor]
MKEKEAIALCGMLSGSRPLSTCKHGCSSSLLQLLAGTSDQASFPSEITFMRSNVWFPSDFSSSYACSTDIMLLHACSFLHLPL